MVGADCKFRRSCLKTHTGEWCSKPKRRRVAECRAIIINMQLNATGMLSDDSPFSRDPPLLELVQPDDGAARLPRGREGHLQVVDVAGGAWVQRCRRVAQGLHYAHRLLYAVPDTIAALSTPMYTDVIKGGHRAEKTEKKTLCSSYS